jgi:hypothetical protein
MIQLWYLLQTISLLIALALGWLGLLWHLRTRQRILRYMVLLSATFSLRVLVRILVYLLYFSGSPIFAALSFPLSLVEQGAFFLGVFGLIGVLEEILHESKTPLPPYLKYLFPVLAIAVQLIIYLIRSAVPGVDFIGLHASMSFRGVAVILALVFLILMMLHNRYFREGDRYSRAVWLTMFLLLLFAPISILLDEILPNNSTIAFRDLLFLPRWFSSVFTMIASLPLALTLLSLITRYRSAIAFIEVERAMQGIQAKYPLNDAQGEVLRYFLERGWGETIQFYGWMYARQQMKPVLAGFGHRSMLELLHRVQIEQADVLPLGA